MVYIGITPISNDNSYKNYEEMIRDTEIHKGLSVWTNTSKNTLKINDYIGLALKKENYTIPFFKIYNIITDEKVDSYIRQRFNWDLDEKSKKRNIIQIEKVEHENCELNTKFKQNLGYKESFRMFQGTNRIDREFSSLDEFINSLK